jgi:hypothetical protein
MNCNRKESQLQKQVWPKDKFFSQTVQCGLKLDICQVRINGQTGTG